MTIIVTYTVCLLLVFILHGRIVRGIALYKTFLCLERFKAYTMLILDVEVLVNIYVVT